MMAEVQEWISNKSSVDGGGDNRRETFPIREKMKQGKDASEPLQSSFSTAASHSGILLTWTQFLSFLSSRIFCDHFKQTTDLLAWSLRGYSFLAISPSR